MKTLTRIELVNDQLIIRYTDDTDKIAAERAMIIKWPDHPAIVKLFKAFQEVLGTYFLTENQNLDNVPEAELDELFKKLLEEPQAPEQPQQGC